MPSLQPETIAWMQSQPTSELTRLLSLMDRDKQVEVLTALRAAPATTEHDKDIQRKREQRQAGAAIVIPGIVDPERRERCLADPERFLLTYGAPDEGKPVELQNGRFWMPFAKHHRRMIDAIYQRAKTGGDKSVAAPRGDGKTTVTWWMLIFIILAELRHHPCAIGSTNKKAKESIFDPIVYELTFNELLYEDFPEICYPLRELDSNALRAKKQHVNGVKTKIVCTQEKLVLPTVPGSPYGGCSLRYYGLDSAIRGARHDFAVIDDPETRAVAFSVPNGGRKAQHQVVEDMIDSDVAGLAFPGRSMPRVVVTTIQNRSCYSYRVTSRDSKEGGKPTFEGERYGILETWPDDELQEGEEITPRAMWDDYIALRQQAQSAGDKDALVAVDYYKENFEKMNRGAKASNPERYDHGNPAELTAIQAFFNRVADWGLHRAMAELQNNPVEEETEQRLGITPGLVASRISGLQQNCLPNANCKIVVGLDIGNSVSHWVKLADFGNAVGVVIDEGFFATRNMIKNPSQEYLTKALLEALGGWRTNMLSENPPDWCLIDSGDGHHQEAIYEFVRQSGTTFAASKGYAQSKFRMPSVGADGKPPAGKLLFQECWAHWQPESGVWLYNVNTEYWKEWAQQRFMTPTFDENQQFNDGSLSLFVPREAKRWLEFSSHVCSEGRETIFIEGKGHESKWKVHNKNNHKLDALALACAAGGVLGVRLIQRVSMATQQAIQRKAKPKQQQNSRFKTRPGGWVQGSKRR